MRLDRSDQVEGRSDWRTQHRALADHYTEKEADLSTPRAHSCWIMSEGPLTYVAPSKSQCQCPAPRRRLDTGIKPHTPTRGLCGGCPEPSFLQLEMKMLWLERFSIDTNVTNSPTGQLNDCSVRSYTGWLTIIAVRHEEDCEISPAVVLLESGNSARTSCCQNKHLSSRLSMVIMASV
jgi:hypothetical protein